VTTPDGKIAGHNRIELILDGRALQENWTGNGGFTGTSLNLYDAAAKTWRQFWIDRAGGVLQLSGGLVDGSMVLEGSSTEDGTTTIDRITWTPNADGSVRQFWEQSKDNRRTWTAAFDEFVSRGGGGGRRGLRAGARKRVPRTESGRRAKSARHLLGGSA